MDDRYTLERIRQFWERQALEHGISPAASWSDYHVIDMEIRQILSHIEDGDEILDIGCANGFSTMALAQHKHVRIRGIDFIPEMIENAIRRKDDQADEVKERVHFEVGDIMKLNVPGASYDKVVVTRVLINLGSWENQARAIEECSRVLKPGGRLILSEASLQGWRNLNSFRSEWGLPEIPMPPFNLYLDEDKLYEEGARYFKKTGVYSFSSTYYVATRVLKPLLIGAMDVSIDVGNANMHWNRFFSEAPSIGDYGTQKLFVFEKI